MIDDELNPTANSNITNKNERTNERNSRETRHGNNIIITTTRN